MEGVACGEKMEAQGSFSEENPISKLEQEPHKPRNKSWTQEVKDHLNGKFPCACKGLVYRIKS